MRFDRRTVPDVPDALAFAGVCLTGAGLAIAAQTLADTPVPGTLDGLDRIVLGLWRLDLSRLLTLTVGLGLLTLGLGRGARMGGWREPAARAGAGIAVGATIVALAVVLGSTWAAIAGSVGTVKITGDTRLFHWLAQVVTALGFSGVWALAAARMTLAAGVRVDPIDDDEPEVEDSPPSSVVPTPTIEPEPPLVARAPVVVPPAPAPRAAEVPPTPPQVSSASRASELYRERLSFSPRAAEAKALVEEIGRLERDGKGSDAERLLTKLQSL